MTRSFPGLRLLLAGVLLAALTTVAGPSLPAAASVCDSGSGVTVVVDDQGSIATGCAPAGGTGLDALTGAGFSFAFVPRQPGLVCTIEGRPDPCNGAPTTAYWSYWHARPGGAWVYSDLGAGSYTPAAGSVEGWSFGAGTPPGVAPPAPATTASTASSTLSSTRTASVATVPTDPPPATTRTTVPVTPTTSVPTSETSAASTTAPGRTRLTSPAGTITSLPVTPAPTPPASRSAGSPDPTPPAPRRSSARSGSITASSPPVASAPAPLRSGSSATSRAGASSAAAAGSPSSGAGAPTTAGAAATVAADVSPVAERGGAVGGWWAVGLGALAVLALGGAALVLRQRRSPS